MSSVSIYRSREGEEELSSLYDEALTRLGRATESRTVTTRFGDTHVLVTGPVDAPPAVVFHGGNFINPYTLAWVLPALDGFRVHAPDTIGHPGRSAQVRLSLRDDSYGHWAVDVLDGLGLDRPAVVGSSFGAGIVLRLATVAPERIELAVLHIPAGIAAASLPRMIVAVALPMLRYRLRPTRTRLERAARPLSSEPLDDLGLRILGAVYRYVKLETGLPRQAQAAELARFTAPTLVLAAERDIFYPAETVLPQARAILPNLVAAERLPGGHLPSPEALVQLRQRMGGFFHRPGSAVG